MSLPNLASLSQGQNLTPVGSHGDQELTPSVKKGSVDRRDIWWCVAYGWLESGIAPKQKHLHLPQFHTWCSQGVETPFPWLQTAWTQVAGLCAQILSGGTLALDS